ncbi:MAG: 23S rRNA (uracil(747)-C(5))-methyltransferase RlmC [Plesiomonas sp.]
MFCAHFQAGECRSCHWLDKPYTEQLTLKQQALETLFCAIPVQQWLPAVHSAEQAFRNKAKMVVSGAVERPILGIVNADGAAVDLSDCPLYNADFQALFPVIKQFIGRAGLTPYNVARRRGELKFILLTQSAANGEFMLRFVLKSDQKLALIRRELPWLQAQLPQLRVISVNIQPVHMAILEGEQEIMLTDDHSLSEQFNHVPLSIRPRSFFQTNPQIAARLYATARDWVQALPINSLWDLFCGVGGFGLHCATPEMKLTGIEISPEAIDCARASAKQLSLSDVHFQALDSSAFACRHQADHGTHPEEPQSEAGDESDRVKNRDNVPDLVLVNPPRRGIGQALCNYLATMAPDYIVYSSCNANTMAEDIVRLNGGAQQYQVEKMQLFDMFPHTAHYEVIGLLKRV